MRSLLLLSALALLGFLAAPVPAKADLSMSGKQQKVVEKPGESIGTATSKTTLDLNRYIKLEKNNTAPATCDATQDGAIALTSGYALCVCKNGSGWVNVYDSLTACSW